MLGNIRFSNNFNESTLRFLKFSKKKRDAFIPLVALPAWKEKILTHFESTGYPFASVWLDSIQITNGIVEGILETDPGPFYTIDSIAIHGPVKISNHFIANHLGIPKKSPYNINLINKTDSRLQTLNFIATEQPSNISLLGNGAVLNVYLKPKKSNTINGILGIQPSTSKINGFRVTGDFTLDLKNSFGNGENLWLKWQQLQEKSPRLQMGVSWPYLFKSSIGIDASFELFKKDSQFLQIQTKIGFKQTNSANSSIGAYLQWNNSNLLSGAVDSNKIKAERKLPENQDVQIAGIGFNANWNNTDYLYNPQKGNELILQIFGAGRKLIPNNNILNIRNNGFDGSVLYDSVSLNSVQCRTKIKYAHYFKTSKYATFKLGLQSGVLLGKQFFKNELFQIGGFSTLRGFDEESKYANQYAILTLEQRYLLGKNSFICFFGDGALVSNTIQNKKNNYQMLGIGTGITYETKAGILNLSLAFGSSNDRNFVIRESIKLHFGFINVF
jgi:outer membrane protein assembly factor BamA